MGTYTVKKGMRYRAYISLSLFESMAGNDIIKQKLVDAGFTDVKVAGDGSERQAVGTWAHDDATAEMPSQIVKVEVV